MSLVGPRPEQPEFEKQFAEEIPFYRYRRLVKPGITGWAQTKYAYAASVEETMKKLERRTIRSGCLFISPVTHLRRRRRR